ncbi:hypothetical protein [Methanobrevibacter ruminantium]
MSSPSKFNVTEYVLAAFVILNLPTPLLLVIAERVFPLIVSVTS